VSTVINSHHPSQTSGLRPAPGVIARDMGSAAVLIHLESNRIFELNTTGARIWSLVEQSLTRDEIVSRLKTEYADATDLEETVDALLADLRREGLIDE
jgi:hypothetical protein